MKVEDFPWVAYKLVAYKKKYVYLSPKKLFQLP